MSRLVFPLLCLVVVLAVAAACDLVDPMRPSPQPDSETFGGLLEIAPDPSQPGAWIARLRVGVPRALGRTDDAQPTPDVAGGILALVKITGDTIVTVDDAPAAAVDIGPGTELVAIPVPGTTTMFGEKELHLEAAQLMDFETYARWRMPKLELSARKQVIDDPNRINSDGIENGPIPLAGGSVLYFTARLRSPEVAGGPWFGAQREGLSEPVDGTRSFERSFRTELGAEGWTPPAAVWFPGLGTDQHVKVTWVSADELTCYVTVSDPEGSPWVGVSQRRATSEAWGEVERVDTTGDGDAFDAVVMIGSPQRMVFATTRSGGGDLYMFDPTAGPAQPLQPELNSAGLEWAPRIGPDNELYFVRGDRQLRFRGGQIDEVRLPGAHRIVLVESAPTADGRWLFFATPKLRPVELDLDIQVAPIAADGSLGAPVPVDLWRP